MYWLDWMTNLAGLFLWLSWRGFGSVPVSPRPALTLASTLRPAGSPRAGVFWFLPGLLLLLAVRALIHHEFPAQFAEAAVWSPGPVSVTFRSDRLPRMAAYSVLAWVQAALTLYLWFMVLAALRRKEREPDILTRTLRAELGWFARWPVWLSPLPVIVLSGLLWLAIAGPLARTGLLPPFASSRHVWQQALVVGVAVLGSLKWPLTAACLLKFLLDRVYVGGSPLWEYAHGIGGTVSSWPRRLPLRFGALDFSSLAAGAGWWAAGWFLDGLAARVFQRLPL